MRERKCVDEGVKITCNEPQEIVQVVDNAMPDGVVKNELGNPYIYVSFQTP